MSKVKLRCLYLNRSVVVTGSGIVPRRSTHRYLDSSSRGLLPFSSVRVLRLRPTIATNVTPYEESEPSNLYWSYNPTPRCSVSEGPVGTRGASRLSVSWTSVSQEGRGNDEEHDPRSKHKGPLCHRHPEVQRLDELEGSSGVTHLG